MTMARRALACGLALTWLTPTLIAAQDFPAKPIRIVVPFGPGSATDIAARVIASAVAAETGRPVTIDNRPGAEGQIGAQVAASAPPDSYTIFITTQTTQASNFSVYKSLPYDPVKSFIPITGIGRGPQLVLARPDLPAASIGELIALARRQPGKLTFGSGNGSSRAGGELFKIMTGIDLLNVPYKSQPQVIVDLLGGRIDLTFTDMTTGLAPARDGRAKLLAVTSTARLPTLPDVPTVAESGVAGFEMWAWNAAYVPAGTPRPVVDRLNKLIRAAVESEAYRTLAEQSGAVLFAGTPEALAAFQQEEIAKWAQIVKATGMAEP
jgi:tripartite-type tricarboxylate transporter receptor subunit TctC